MADSAYDVVVIGGGPGGYPAAIRCRQLGLRVCVVEREHLGGICLNWGCIPTKALLRSSEVGHLLGRLKDFGFSASDVQFDIKEIVKRSRKVSKRLNTGVKSLLKKNAVEVFDGSGRLAGAGRVIVEKDGATVAELEARNIILATGARARSLPGLEADGQIVWSYKEAMVPEEMPGSLLVVGSGAIGMEFASFYSDLGADVTVVETLPRILPVEDEEISALAHKQFTRQGMKLHTSTTVTALERKADGAEAVIEKEGGESERIEVDRVILAVGIVGNVENLGLEGTGVEVDRTHIVTNTFCETGEPGVYAIGDVAGPPWLAHKATHEGVLAAERIAGVGHVHPLDTDRIPGCTYCRPQIASVGLTEAQASEAGRQVRVGRFPFVGNGKAIALGETDGLVKTVFDAATGELLGAHMIGAEVTELIQGFVVAMNLETTEAELMQTIFAHPTLSEMMHESVLAAYDQAIHI
jgi:dihydrolipoamide dehydrogenase